MRRRSSARFDSAQPDSQFGAASYKDFGCDSFPFSVDQAVTTSTTDALNGINTWSAFGGCDIPEAQLNALYELANGAAGFRANSTRVIVWFGDASGHDPSNGHTLTDVTDLLKAANVVVIAIPVDTGSETASMAPTRLLTSPTRQAAR